MPTPKRFVDLQSHGFLIEPRYYFWGWSKTPKLRARPSVVSALKRAQKSLPKGFRFKIWDAQRPIEVQLLMIESFKKRLKLANPDLTPSELKQLLFTFASVPKNIVTRLDHHRTGGSLDLTVVDGKGRELWMGTDHDDLTPRAAVAHFDRHPPTSPADREAHRNRRILYKAMRAAGFISYAPEWWHWSLDK
jgi:zinc D-Ala-D-Ala dipeptidase